MDNLVFIITRCVRKPEHNRLHIECCRCIRKLYENRIYIIDDNSDMNILIPTDVSNVEVIQSEFPGAGEILPYYYMYHRKLGKKAIILQDSMFIQHKLDVDIIEDYKFLWRFNNDNCIGEVREKLREVSYTLPVYEDLYGIIFEYKWSGCFGSCMVLTLDFLTEMHDRTQVLSILNDITIRSDRCMLERLLGICAYYIKEKNNVDSSILGSIFEQPFKWGYTYEEYIAYPAMRHCPIVKVWNGR